MAGPARTLVVIPAYNEEQSLPGVLKELAEQTPEYDVLVVSDGSIDRTAEVARTAGVTRVLSVKSAPPYTTRWPMTSIASGPASIARGPDQSGVSNRCRDCSPFSLSFSQHSPDGASPSAPGASSSNSEALTLLDPAFSARTLVGDIGG